MAPREKKYLGAWPPNTLIAPGAPRTPAALAGAVFELPSRSGVMAPREKKYLGAWPRLTMIAPGAARTPAALAGAFAAGSLNRRPAQGSLRTLRAGRLRRADLQPYLGLAIGI